MYSRHGGDAGAMVGKMTWGPVDAAEPRLVKRKGQPKAIPMALGYEDTAAYRVAS